MNQETTIEQINKLIEFRQTIYEEGLIGYRDAQFELMDSVLCNQKVGSYPELSQTPLFQRKWHSVYQGMKAGRQKRKKLRQTMCQQVPTGQQVLSLDSTIWQHPRARTLQGQVYEHASAINKQKHQALVGHVYSCLCWIPKRGESWALPVSSSRLSPKRTTTELGMAQVASWVKWRQAQGATQPDIVVADAKYGTKFLAQSKGLEVVAVTRLRSDRVLYQPPSEYKGRGTRKRKHGKRFAFKEVDTWGTPALTLSFVDARWGKVQLQVWHHLHPKQDADTEFSVIHVATHLDKEEKKRPKSIWLGYGSPKPVDAKTVWLAFDHRWSIEPHFRFRKQRLYWTLPAFQQSDRCDRWTQLIDCLLWQLYLARDCVQAKPLPWQKGLTRLTPGRVLQNFAPLFAQIDTPTQPVKQRGIPPGWPKGCPRTRPKRYSVVKRGRP